MSIWIKSTPQNLDNLKEVCEIDLNEPSWFSSGILKVGRTLYVTTRRMTYAIDAETCELRWRHVVHDIVKVGDFGSSNNRGVAYLDESSFVALPMAALFRSTPKSARNCGRLLAATKLRQNVPELRRASPL